MEIGERTDPQGAQDRPVTLRLESASSLATGFAGCNRFSAGYTLRADSLRFEVPISTKMACDQGMDVETAYLGALLEIRTYAATESTFTLNDSAGPRARFRPM